MNAPEILEIASNLISDRGRERDKGQERSMRSTVEAFNAITGKDLAETDGWLFMEMLKMARAYGGQFKFDDYLDGVAYSALRAECAFKSNPEIDPNAVCGGGS